MTSEEYKAKIARLEALKDIEDNDSRVDEYNELFDEVLDYENENGIYITRLT